MEGQFHWNPETYLDEIQADLPLYRELQEATIDSIPFAPRRVLELGVGTGETTRRLLERFPRAEVTGLDGTPAMVFHARNLGIDVRLGRMEDPLPDGPWDLVISVLAVHHLDADAKRDLFRRATWSRSIRRRSSSSRASTCPHRRPLRPTGRAARSSGSGATSRSSGRPTTDPPLSEREVDLDIRD
jgi:SAM-dependent methyltransferase